MMRALDERISDLVLLESASERLRNVGLFGSQYLQWTEAQRGAAAPCFGGTSCLWVALMERGAFVVPGSLRPEDRCQ
jgi:hypothetical protein